jgi:hypothetical protein
MNTFKRKALFTAVVAGLGVAGSAEAVFIAPNQTGQALLFPYYTVQNAGTNSWNTYISVVNTTDLAKAVKVRILEGRTSAEVLDFNLYLSANDVWTAAIVPVDATDGSAGKIITADASCTAPPISITGATSVFRNYQYSGQAAGLGRGLDRTREGYIEMIEMASFPAGTATYDAVTHDASGVPDDCSFVQVADQTLINLDAIPQTGGLTGTGTLINVNLGQDVGYKPDALEAFSNLGVVTGPGLTTPSLEEVLPTSSVVFNSGYDAVNLTSMVATVYRNDWAGGSHVSAGAQALASVFQHQSIMNEYILDSAVAGLTDWVVTQPIKSAFVDASTAAPPYTNALTASGACETIEFQYFNREERGAAAAGIDFSPPPPAGNPSSICWESTVLSIRNGAAHMPPPSSTVSGVLGSRNSTAIQLASGFQNGWARLTFTGTNAVVEGLTADVTSDGAIFDTNVPTTLIPAGPAQFFGLPVTGFMIRTFGNNTLTCGTASCQGSYSALFNHAYTNLITP